MSDSSQPIPISKPRLLEARRLGYTPRSPELTIGVVLISTAWISHSSLPKLVAALQNLMSDSFQPVPLHGGWVVRGGLEAIGLELLRILVAAWATALVLDLLQVGWVWSPATPLPHEERVNPISGLQRLLGWPTWERAALLSFKLAIAGLLIGGSVWLGLSNLDQLSGSERLSPLIHWSCGLTAAVGALCVLSGLLDAWSRRTRWRTSLEQSEEERRRGG